MKKALLTITLGLGLTGCYTSMGYLAECYNKHIERIGKPYVYIDSKSLESNIINCENQVDNVELWSKSFTEKRMKQDQMWGIVKSVFKWIGRLILYLIPIYIISAIIISAIIIIRERSRKTKELKKKYRKK